MAVSLVAVIIVALLALFYQTQRAFRSGVSQVEMLQASRAALEIISRDLQEMYPSGRSNVVDFFALVPNAIPPLPPTLQDLPGGGARLNELQELTFVSRVNDDWVVTAYRVGDWQLGVGTLYRGVAKVNFDHLPFTNALAIGWMPGPLDAPRVLDGVIHFRVQAFDTNSAWVPEGPVSFRAPNANLAGHGYGFSGATNLPSFLEVELGVLDPVALAQFRSRTNSLNPTTARTYLKDKARAVQLFKQRVPIRSQPVLLSSASD